MAFKLTTAPMTKAEWDHMISERVSHGDYTAEDEEYEEYVASFDKVVKWIREA